MKGRAGEEEGTETGKERGTLSPHQQLARGGGVEGGDCDGLKKSQRTHSYLQPSLPRDKRLQIKTTIGT